jgi:uncharacterized metal-binding protein YceD (DUF177 family)
VSPLSNWIHAVADIPEGGLKREQVASLEERAAIVSELRLLSLEVLDAAYRIDRLAGGGYRLHGRVTASLEQPCVVTLDAVAATIDEDFDTEFWPEVAARDGEQDAAVLDGRDVETLENGAIAAGRVIFETLSAALDPYPRGAGAEFQWQDKAVGEVAKISPFAALSKLKDKT